jgi:hypothetical protein
LTIHTASDQDFFRFTTVAAATAAHSITLDFNSSDGDLDLLLFDSAGGLIRQSTQTASIENISSAGLSAGTYTLAVKAKSSGFNTYHLAFDTPLPSGEKDDWTIMVYMASNSQEKQAFDASNELEKAALALPGTVNLVVYWDQSSTGRNTQRVMAHRLLGEQQVKECCVRIVIRRVWQRVLTCLQSRTAALLLR